MKKTTVPHLVLAMVRKFARAEGYDEARLIEGLTFAQKRMWWPGAGIPWDDAAELFARLDSCHPDTLRKFAAFYIQSFPLLGWLATYVLSTERLYRLAFYAWSRVWPFHLTTRQTASGYEVDLQIAPELRSGEAIFRLGAEILRLLPTKIDHDPAQVELRVASHECTWTICLSPAHRSSQAAEDKADDDIFHTLVGDVFPALAPLAIPEAWMLTRAEARVAQQIVAGRSVKEIARDLYVSQETVRTHLKRVMTKAGVRRQAELVTRLLSRHGEGSSS